MTNQIWIALTLIALTAMLGYGSVKERHVPVPQIGAIFK